MSSPVILVQVQLPTVRPGIPGYSDPSTWVWVPCLEFPVKRVNELKFSSKPFKWVRYCTGAVTGAQGDLSRKADCLEVIDYDRPLSSESMPESMVLYYHVPDAEKEHMFPTDHYLADPPKTNSVHSRASTTTSSVACQDFRQDLLARDTRCVAMGWNEMYCDAVHLVPHCKDDEYIKTLTTRRCRGRECDIVPAIDDVRNGVLLQAGLHKIFRQTLAFMPVPNFALDASDVIPGAHPSEHTCIIHLFEPHQPPYDISNTRLALEADTDQWPPSALFDAVYGAVVLRNFGVPAARARVADIWEELYYPRGGFEATAADIRGRKRRDRARRAVGPGLRLSEGEPGADYLDLTVLVPYLAMAPDELAVYFDRMEDRAMEDEHQSIAEKVRKWRESVIASSA